MVSKKKKRERLSEIGAGYMSNSGWYIFDSNLFYLGKDIEEAYENINSDYDTIQKVADVERRLKEHENEILKVVTGKAKECAQNRYIVNDNVVDFSLIKIRTLFDDQVITVAGKVYDNKIIAYGYTHHALSEKDEVSFFCDDIAKRIKACDALDDFESS